MNNQGNMKGDVAGMVSRAISSADNTNDANAVRAAKIGAAGRIAAAYVEAQGRKEAAEAFAATLAKAMRD